MDDGRAASRGNEPRRPSAHESVHPGVRVRVRGALVATIVLCLAMHDAGRGRTAMRAHGDARMEATRAAVVAAIGGVTRTVRGMTTTTLRRAVARASVRAILVHDGVSYPLDETTSDADGRFVFEALPPGAYWFVATARGLARGVATATVDQDVRDVDVRLEPAAVLRGTVLDRSDPSHGIQLAGVVVHATLEGVDGDLPAVATTDARGDFEFDALVPATYRLSVAPDGYVPQARIEVTAPGEPVVFALQAAASLTGVVVALDGRPAPNVTVQIAGSGLWPPRTLRTDANGAFASGDVAPGVYEVRARDGERVADPIAPIVLDARTRRDVRLQLANGATLAGTVIDDRTRAPVEGARVIVSEDALSTSPDALLTDATGAFRATGLLHRAHSVTVHAAGYLATQSALVMPSDAPLEMRMAREVVVHGRVVDVRGRPIAGAGIEVVAEDLDGRTTVLDGASSAFRDRLFAAQAGTAPAIVPSGELGIMPGPVPRIPNALSVASTPADPGFTTALDGTFTVHEIPPGIVRVAASHPAFVRSETLRRAVASGDEQQCEIVLHAGGSLEGRVVDERGYPVANQTVEIRTVQDALPKRVQTARDGTFRVGALLGRVSAVAMFGARPLARAETEVLDETVATMNLVLDRDVRRVLGRVVDSAGFPVGGAEVTLVGGGAAGPLRTVTAGDGTFVSLRIGSHPVSLEVRHPGFAPQDVRLAPDAVDALVTMDRGASFTVDVRDDGCAASEATLTLRSPCGTSARIARSPATVTFEHLCRGALAVRVEAAGCVPAAREGSAGGSARVELIGGGTVDGTVVDSRGAAVPGARVTLGVPSAASTGVRADRDGAFVLDALPEGEQSLVAYHPLLGRTAPVATRIVRGTVAHGVALVFDRTLADATAPTAVPYALHDHEGRVVVTSVASGSSPARAGLLVGDVLAEVDGTAIGTATEGLARLDGPVGDEVHATVVRGGATRALHWTREGAAATGR